MYDACAPFRPLLDGLADGEIEPSRVESHLSACAPCRAELEAVRSLKARLAKVRLPDVPRRRSHRRRAAIAVAAALFAAIFLGVYLAEPAPLYALTARFHDDVLSGRITLSDFGIPPTARKADYADGCPCPPGLGEASPFIVYRHEGAAVSLLAFEPSKPWPLGARRVGDDNVIQEWRNGMALIWISRLDKAALRRAAERWRPAPGMSLREIACKACCALLETREGGEGPVSIELLTGPGGRRIEPTLTTALRPLPLAK